MSEHVIEYAMSLVRIKNGNWKFTSIIFIMIYKTIQIIRIITMHYHSIEYRCLAFRLSCQS